MKRQLTALVRKDLLLFRADRRAVIVSFAVPAMLALLFGLVFRSNSGGGAMHVSSRVVDLDGSAASRRLVDALGKDPVLAATPSSRSEAEELVRRGKIDVALVIPEHFAAGAAAASRGGSDRPEIAVLAGPTAKIEAGLAQGVLTRAAMQSLGPELDPEFVRCAGTGAPFHAEVRAVSGGDSRYHGAAHALAGMGVQFILIGAIDSAVGLLNERQQGLFRRFRAAPLSRAVLIASRLISSAIIALAVIVFLYAFGSATMGIRIQGSMAGFALIAVGFAFMAASLGVLVSTFGKSPQATRGGGIFIVLIGTMLSGAWFPAFLFPSWLRTATLFVPSRWAVDGLDAMTWRGLGLDAALAPAGVLLLSAVVLGAWAAARFRWD
jgi:ABC-2 type transport system permease protein